MYFQVFSALMVVDNFKIRLLTLGGYYRLRYLFWRRNITRIFIPTYSELDTRGAAYYLIILPFKVDYYRLGKCTMSGAKKG
jgi:hypothetical protein